MPNQPIKAQKRSENQSENQSERGKKQPQSTDTMKHGRPFRKLSRSSSHRRALLRNLATSLIAHERIITTRAKAMEIKRYTDALIDSARRAYLADSQRAVGGIEASLFVRFCLGSLDLDASSGISVLRCFF